MNLLVIGLLLTALGLLIWPEVPSETTGSAGPPRQPGFAVPPTHADHAWALGSRGAVNGSGRKAATLWPGLRKIGPGVGVVLAIPLVAPGLWWTGVPAGVVLTLFLRRRAAKPTSGQLIDRRRQLAGRLDLVAACLRSGLPVGSAMVAVTQACGAPAEDPAPATSLAFRHPVGVLGEVAALLALGADPPAAWASAAAHPDLASIAAAACRSATGGSTLAAAFAEQSELLRRRNSEATASAAGRAGVMMTAPLGACFLPAFLCLGLAPAVVGLLGTLRMW